MALFDKKGGCFEIKLFSTEAYPPLRRMYEDFSPKGRYQGMPPVDPNCLEAWLQGLIRKGINLIAWQDNRAVGHAALLPDFIKKDAEYVIFVLQSCRGSGMGNALTEAAVEKARDLRIETIWLSVDAYNFRATRLYKKFGFRFCEEHSMVSERVMLLRLLPK
ncbi:MAG: GNAT family N-acetyltransferase [Thermodesulfobacteriota bacterium]